MYRIVMLKCAAIACVLVVGLSHFKAVASASTPEAILPGDLLLVTEQDEHRHLTLMAPRLAARATQAEHLDNLAIVDLAVAPTTGDVFAISDHKGGTLYRLNQSMAMTFDGPNRTWTNGGYRQVIATSEAIYLLSERNSGTLVRASLDLGQVKWGPDGLQATKIAASPDGRWVYVASDADGGTIYRYPQDLDATQRIGGAQQGLSELDIVDLVINDAGHVIATTARAGGSLLVFDEDLNLVFDGPTEDVTGLSPQMIVADGGELLVVSSASDGRVLRLDQRGQRIAESAEIPDVRGVRVSELDGSVVAWSDGEDGKLFRLSRDLGTVLHEQAMQGKRVVAMAAVPWPHEPIRLTPHESWQNALKPVGKTAGKLEVTRDGDPRVRIVIPATPTPQEEKAAIELVFWLKVATGVQLPIAYDSDDDASDLGMISLGQTRHAAEAGLQADSSLDDEGYRIAMRGDDLYIVGGPRRGPIYGVIALLEEDLGIRWFDRHSVMVAHEGNLSIAPVARVSNPALERRDPLYTDTFNTEWSLLNRTNAMSAPVPAAWGGYAQTVPSFVHTYALLLPPHEFFADHPEWFAFIQGERNARQLCPMHPEARQKVIERVKGFLKATPTARYVDVSPNDYWDYCQCDLCNEVIEREGGVGTGPNLSLVNAVAEAIAEDHADVRVTTLAYLSTVEPPRHMRPHENVRIFYATNNHWSWICIPVTGNETILRHVDAWREIGAPLDIWHYPIDYHRYVRPVLNMPAMTTDLRYFVEQGATGFMFQGNHSHSVGVDRALLRSWVWAKQMWDPMRDTRALIRDFTYGYYGQAAEPIQNYHDWLWQLSLDLQQSEYFVEGLRHWEPVYRPEFVQRARRYMDEALQLAEGDELLTSRVRLARLPVLFVEAELGVTDDVAEYLSVVDEIEQTARANGVLFLKSGLANSYDRERMLQAWRDLATVDPKKISHASVGPEWKLKADPDNEGMREKWFAPDHDHTDWMNAKVGAQWGSIGLPGYVGYGWYRTTINPTSEQLQHKHLFLLFGAADEYAEVYLDGKLVLDHTYGATLLPPEASWNKPFAVDVRDKLQAGRSHVVTVRVQNTQLAGGLWKPVWLVSTDQNLPAESMLHFVNVAEGDY